MIRLAKVLLLTVLWLSVRDSPGQLPAAIAPFKTYPFVNEELNLISNYDHLSGLMEKLYDLRKNRNRTISILHIGDSHLQADYISAVIRTSLQNEFGNGGRGLVVPYRLAKTNEPSDYRSSSVFVWQSKRCVFPQQPLPIGIGGITLSTKDSCADFTLKTSDDSLLSYRFNKVTLFHLKGPSGYNFAITDSLGNRIGTITNDSTEKYPFTSSALFQAPVNRMTVRVTRTAEQQVEATIFGLVLENGHPGILYHTIGVNGAQFVNYSEARYFSEQTRILRPDLIIVSLGTNEAYSVNFKPDVFYDQMKVLYDQLKQQNPDAGFIFTIPACSYRRKKPNPRLVTAAKTISKFANDNNFSCWDLQGATGGDNSALNWKKYRLLRPDGVHYTQTGYELQGKLFCKAFLNAYNDYVTNRPQ